MKDIQRCLVFDGHPKHVNLLAYFVGQRPSIQPTQCFPKLLHSITPNNHGISKFSLQCQVESYPALYKLTWSVWDLCYKAFPG